MIPYDEGALSLLPGGRMAVGMRKRHGVGKQYAQTRDKKWGHWLQFCKVGNGQGIEYNPMLFSLRKFRLFAGWLVESGVTRAVDMGVWRSAINNGFAREELGRPARGFDVQQILNEWNADQLATRELALGGRKLASRMPPSPAWVQELVRLGQRASGSRLQKIAVILLAVLFGMRAATLGGCRPGDCFFRSPAVLVFMHRCVKKWPELRLFPGVRERTDPGNARCAVGGKHPRAQVMKIIRRASSADADFVVTVLSAQVPVNATDDEIEKLASSQITGWMRALIPNPEKFGVVLEGGDFLASHSPRIMLASACDAVPYMRARVQRELFWRAAASHERYIRVYPYSKWLAALYDFFA